MDTLLGVEFLFLAALDAHGLGMIAPLIRGRSILCLGYPDITAAPALVEKLLGVRPEKWTDYGLAHKIRWRLPETIDTFRLAGAGIVDVVDSMPSRVVERVVDLNVRQDWERSYGIVINPGTLEHCFDVSTATFNAWRALEPGGFLLNVAPLSMINHGFWNVSPTAICDFATANGGTVLNMFGIAKDGTKLALEPFKRFRVPPDAVAYALLRKDAVVPETIPVQRRFRA